MAWSGFPKKTRWEEPEGVPSTADRKPPPWDAPLIESPLIADHQIAGIDWRASERLPETEVKSAAPPPLGEVLGSAEAEVPPWLVHARLVDNAARPSTASVDETRSEGEMRPTGPERNVVAQPRRADARRFVKGRSVAIAAACLLMLALAGTYWLSGPGMNSSLAASISNAIPREFSLRAFAKSSDLVAPSDEQNLVSARPKNVSTIRINPPAGSESSPIAPLITPVAQRAVLYEEDPTDSKGKRYTGGGALRTEDNSTTARAAPRLGVKDRPKGVEPKTALVFTFRAHTRPAKHHCPVL